MIDKDKAFRDFKTLRGTPDFWDDAKKDLFAMLRQLGQPSFFYTFSSADTHWPDLLRCLWTNKHGRPPTDTEWDDFLQHKTDRFDLVREDPVTCSR
jgi:hypothetical protein